MIPGSDYRAMSQIRGWGGRQGGRMTRYGITAHIVVNPSNYREMNSGFVDVGLSKKISKKYCIDDSGVIFERNK